MNATGSVPIDNDTKDLNDTLYRGKKSPEWEEIECQDDIDLCCRPLSSCASYDCPRGYRSKRLIGGEHPFCLTDECNDPSDKEVCCEKLAHCSTYFCPTGFKWTGQAEDKFCHAPKCTDLDDVYTCCSRQASCNTFNCPPEYRPKSGTQNYCAESVCDRHSEGDRERCCVKAAPCSQITCPPFNWRRETPGLMCSDIKCGPQDVETCCTNSTAEHRQPNFAQYSPCGTSKWPGGVAPCSDFQCPIGSFRKLEVGLSFDVVDCTSDSTRSAEKCCNFGGRCAANYKCPPNFSPKAETAYALSCVGGCGESSPDNLNTVVCCEAHEHCIKYQCPDGFRAKRAESGGTDGLFCDSVHCGTSSPDNSNTFRCCDPLRSCSSSYTCAAGFRPRVGWDHIYCAEAPGDLFVGDGGGDCGPDASRENPNNEICCAAFESCSAYLCPEGWFRKTEAFLTCNSDKCGNTSVKNNNTDRCCEPTSCSGYKCPSGWRHKEQFENVTCAGKTCGTPAIDNINNALCCDRGMPCTQYTCPFGHHRKSAAGLFCDPEYADCGVNRSTNTELCCDSHACSTYTCPDGLTPKPGDHACAGMSCGATSYSNENTDMCCDTTYCHLYVCPDGWDPMSDTHSGSLHSQCDGVCGVSSPENPNTARCCVRKEVQAKEEAKVGFIERLKGVRKFFFGGVQPQ
eukprot:gnl/TRDRNA2_/TRDRNA2_145315_c0_seq1.p1 gnl/TRDRNA2_/TRDRNA2_145315_c0~~gnl/TRDRNA2_/TRDRNA2_145315_c0_seq1.p1  ORF type:complete len:740 (+),score=72.99 gnl/TRDRNA2_/TRDRNA2_145315_c0_seq1:180-2222(+)